MQKLRSQTAGGAERIRAGEQVHARGESWLVVQHDTFDGCALVTLRGAGDLNLGTTALLLTPFDRIGLPPHAPRLRRAPRRSALARAALAVAQGHRWTDLWTAADARIDLHPWQLEPALAVIGGATRVLLADEVGLGKTIQAGLILNELRARHLATRALVLTPASLREQWAAELEERFGLAPLVFDHAALARLVGDLPVGVNPWGTSELVISSIDLVKRPEVRTAIDAVPFDVLIVDEAHHLRPGTDRVALAADLSSRIPWVVLATATPHSGDERAYALLRGLGQLAPDETLAVFRRSAAEVGRPRARHERFLGLTATAAEQALLDDTLAYARALWREHHREPHAAILASVICRRAVSSAHALLRTLARRRDLLGSAGAAPLRQPELPWAECDAADDLEQDDLLASGCLDDRGRELAWLDRLIALGRHAASSSKALVIERLLRRTREPALVFTEYRDTIADLETRLSGRASLAVLHGGLTPRERRAAMHAFTSGKARVLLATDAAGEGLNLQARCRLVINIELPWNPLRLEQRIGRVDRLGQTRRVHALHLFHRGSFEDVVLARLHQRMRAAASALDAHAIDEGTVAAGIFDAAPLPDVPVRAASVEVPPDGSHVAAGVVVQRRARALLVSRSVRTAPICAAPAGRQRLTGHWALVFQLTMHDAAGRFVAREVLPVVVWLDRPLRVHREAVCRFCELLAASPEVSALLDRELDARRQSTRDALARTADGIEQRLRALAAAIERTEPVLIQTSLFDKRAEREARANDLVTAARRTQLQQRLGAVRSLVDGDVSAGARLVAAWPWVE